MNRRHFVTNGFFAGLSIASLSLVSCQFNSRTKKEDKTPAIAFDIVESTIQQLQEKVKGGELTYVALTQIYLQRIRDLDKAGPMLNSVIELNPDALVIAEKMDQELKEGKWREPLHGIPVLIKDNIDFWTGYGTYTPAAITGYPSITVPMGYLNGLPVGLSFVGQAFTEPLLVGVGYAFEQKSKNRKVPEFLSTLK